MKQSSSSSSSSSSASSKHSEPNHLRTTPVINSLTDTDQTTVSNVVVGGGGVGVGGSIIYLNLIPRIINKQRISSTNSTVSSNSNSTNNNQSLLNHPSSAPNSTIISTSASPSIILSSPIILRQPIDHHHSQNQFNNSLSQLLVRRPSQVSRSSSTTSLTNLKSSNFYHHHHHRSQSCRPILLRAQSSNSLVCKPVGLGSAQDLLRRALEDDRLERQLIGDSDLLIVRKDDEGMMLVMEDGEVSLEEEGSEDGFESCSEIRRNGSVGSSLEVGMDPLLVELELNSRLNVQAKCATCGKVGINFPKCPRRKLEFCSRNCRVNCEDESKTQNVN